MLYLREIMSYMWRRVGGSTIHWGFIYKGVEANTPYNIYFMQQKSVDQNLKEFENLLEKCKAGLM